MGLSEKIFSRCVREGECLVWVGAKTSKGYGCIKSKSGTRLTHRIVYKEIHGDIPDNIDVCHKCDNPSCCNPDHLFSGTRKENMMDMVNKGRIAILPNNKKNSAPEGKRYCYICKEYVDISKFKKNAYKKDGLECECADCHRKRTSEYMRRKRSKVRNNIAR